MKRRRNFGTLRTPLGDVPVTQEATARALHEMQDEINHLHQSLTAARKRIAELEAQHGTQQGITEQSLPGDPAGGGLEAPEDAREAE